MEHMCLAAHDEAAAAQRTYDRQGDLPTLLEVWEGPTYGGLNLENNPTICDAWEQKNVFYDITNKMGHIFGSG